MLCKKPISMRGFTFGCGQCLPCRINKRRVWTNRLVLESKKHEYSQFVTLTYSEENLPKGGTLCLKHVQDYLKRIRKAVSPDKIRYFAVGEYGDLSGRPHYHLAVFGLHPSRARIAYDKWDYGMVDIQPLTHDDAHYITQYIAGYVTKKMTKKDDPRLKGRYPEFARMSLKPAIGSFALTDISKGINSRFGKLIIERTGDVPKLITHSGKSWPLDRTMLNKLRDLQGWKTGFLGRSLPKEILEVREAKFKEKHMQVVQSVAENGLKKHLRIKEEVRKQRVINAETKYKIFNNKGKKL